MGLKSVLFSKARLFVFNRLYCFFGLEGLMGLRFYPLHESIFPGTPLENAPAYTREFQARQALKPKNRL